MSSVGTLCLACGLCCDGTLFGRVRVDAPEAAHARRHGLVVLDQDDGARLVQPCAALEGTCCRIYADRPDTCRRYRCDLAAALAEDELGLDEALALVRETHALRDALAAALPPVPPGSPPTRLQQRAREAHQPQLGAPLAEKTLDLLTDLEERLDHVFRGRRG
jgi:Fe-S-cluster containining protein